MPSPLSADMLTAVEDTATEMVLEILQGVVSEMLVDGRAYGDVDLDRGQRILAFEKAVRSGMMDSLVAVNPQLARQDTEQYERDIAETPVYTGRGA